MPSVWLKSGMTISNSHSCPKSLKLRYLGLNNSHVSAFMSLLALAGMFLETQWEQKLADAWPQCGVPRVEGNQPVSLTVEQCIICVVVHTRNMFEHYTTHNCFVEQEFTLCAGSHFVFFTYKWVLLVCSLFTFTTLHIFRRLTTTFQNKSSLCGYELPSHLFQCQLFSKITRYHKVFLSLSIIQ